MRSVLVVGGYGAVGAPLCRALAASGGHRIVVAGRRLAAAQYLAAAIGGAARCIDLEMPSTWQTALDGIDMVVVCMDQGNTAFVECVFEKGIDYVDLTAGDAFFQSVERLPRPSRSRALLSVGLAPGLTNLMAVCCAGALDVVDSIDIGLMFGMGDRHGRAGVAWVADRLFDPLREKRSSAIDFGFPWGWRRCHAVDFSDQHSLARTLGIGSVATRLCFDSRLATAFVFGMADRFAGSAPVRRLVVRSIGAIRVGSGVCNVAVTARGSRGGEPATAAIRFYGEGESQTTARLAALAMRWLSTGDPRPGVYHGDEVVDPAAYLREVVRAGIGRVVADHDGCGPAAGSAAQAAFGLVA